jgi:hypothetical protein
MEPNVTEAHLEIDKNSGVRILALAREEMQGEIRRQLAPLRATIDFITKAAEVSHLALRRNGYHLLYCRITVGGRFGERLLCSIRGRRSLSMLTRQLSSYGPAFWK